MIKREKYQNLNESTNRELYFFGLNKLGKNSETEATIKMLLLYANDFNNLTDLFTNFDNKCANPKYFKRKLKFLSNGIPLAYVTRRIDFLGTELSINRNVLIPRVETEGLVEKTSEFIKAYGFQKGTFIDCCTGSGCIALSLKKFFPDADVLASDISPKAVYVARKNANKNKIDVKIYIGNKLGPFISRSIKADVLISNPPYVSRMRDIDKNVLDNEPLTAIYCEDGTGFYESYFKEHKSILKDRYLMGFEINFDQEKKLTSLIKRYFGSERVKFEFLKDIYGKTRYLFIFGGIR
jgi:release factor glutamine methyltransferase